MRIALRRSTARCIAAITLSVLVGLPEAHAQDRIRFNDQDLFLSGSNVAWINFARDIGPGTTDLTRFETMFSQLHESGGNAMRLWLHTTGAVTPEWDGNEVVSPGEGAIEDLRAILDLAWRYEVGLQLCLWSFDMLRISNGTTITDRAYALLTDPDLTQTYVDNALVPMVDSLAGHPAIIAWEIFNEAEGMSDEYGWDFNRHVPMADIQRFVNMTSGAIHRTDTSAQVTNGMWSFHVLWDGTPAKRDQAAPLTESELRRAKETLSIKYRHTFTDEEVQAHVAKVQTAVDQNFYSDDALIAAGGDPDGTLDFYNVHYYEWAQTAQSPFHHDYAYWGLDKPLVIGEFFMGGGDDGNPDAVYGIPWQDLYTTLFDRGYAGAMGWQWFNYPDGAEGVVNWPRMLTNMETLWELHREAVDIDPGLRIVYFRADPPGIEAGQESELSWAVTGAAAITLDDGPVDSVGTMTVMPEVITTYTLIAEASDGEADTMRATVDVLDPEEVNRARSQPAVASSEETCCGPTLTAALAVDGDLNTRWSSEWEEGLADDDPDDEWIYVDLGAAFDIQRIVLRWEAAYGAAYDIEVSFDAYTWTTVHQEMASDGGIDEIAFDEPPAGRFVRMRGLERATQWGYSLYEFEVYGLESSIQPPTAAITSPGAGAVVPPGEPLMLRADASDPDGTVTSVSFYGDEELISTVEAAPFEATWDDVPEGPHTIYTIVTDDDGISVRSSTEDLFAFATSGFTRFEAEDATFEGDISRQPNAQASGNAFLDMRDDGTISFSDVAPGRDGEYLITFRYNLFYDVPKDQYLVVNGDTLEELRFNGAPQTWLERGVSVPLRGGANTVEIEKYWGWMYFDYLGVSPDPINVAVEVPDVLPTTFALDQNYPNPFNPATTISFALPRAERVQLRVFDLVGREVAVLLDERRSAGRHTVRFDADELATGLYLYRIEAGDFAQTRKMLLVR